MTNINGVFLTVEQAAGVGRVPVDTVRCWIRQGRMEVIRKAGRVYVMRGVLEGLLVGTCPLCGSRFRRANLRSIYCSTKCRQRANRRKDGMTEKRKDGRKA